MQAPQMINITEEINRLMQQDLPPVASPAQWNPQWNRYTMAPVVNELGQQAMLMGAKGVMMPRPQVPAEEILQQEITEEARGSTVDEGLKMAAAKVSKTSGELPSPSSRTFAQRASLQNCLRQFPSSVPF